MVSNFSISLYNLAITLYFQIASHSGGKGQSNYGNVNDDLS